MLSPVMDDIIRRFPFQSLRFFIRLEEGGKLPEIKGAMWHGWLGHMLRGNSGLYQLLYGTHAVQQPKPYMIRTERNAQTHYQAGEIVFFDLFLLGAACQAAEYLVDHFVGTPCCPLGRQLIPAKVQSIATLTPMGLRSGIYPGRLADWIMVRPVEVWHEVALHIESPLRLKFQGNVIKAGPVPLPFLLDQIIRRFSLLTSYWVDDNPELLATLSRTIPVCDYQWSGTSVYFEDWQRFSVRQNEKLPFGGLMGQICYQGDIGPIIPWLEVGQHLQIGGKTTFGLGHYRLIS